MSGKRIMIVEDEVVQLTALARRLKAAGFDIVGARDGMTAISTARKQRSSTLAQSQLSLSDLARPLAIAMRLSKQERSPTSTNLSTFRSF